MKIASPNTAMAARMIEAACFNVMAAPAGGTIEPKMVEPMPTMMVSTISLMPELMTLPSTRSARNAVLPNSANGTSTNPAKVVSLNSRMVTNSCTASTKNANSTISQAIINTTMVTKFSKNVVNPMSSPALSSNGRDAVNPVSATNPGRIRSCAVNVVADAFSPSPANERNTTSDSDWKLLSSSAKKPTYKILRISCAGILSSPSNAQNKPARTISSPTNTLVRNATSRMAKKLARRKNLYFTGRSRLPEEPSWDDGKQAGFLDFADFLDLPIAARTVPD